MSGKEFGLGNRHQSLHEGDEGVEDILADIAWDIDWLKRIQCVHETLVVREQLITAAEDEVLRERSWRDVIEEVPKEPIIARDQWWRRLNYLEAVSR